VALLLLVAGVAVLSLVALAGAGTRGGLSDELREVKQATALYQDLARAGQDGYVRGSPCEAIASGGMGYHYVNPALARDLAVDPLRPEVLLYAPKQSGELKLVGVEYFAPALANTPTGPAPWFGAAPPPGGFFNPAPTLFGQTFDGPMAGHSPEMPWHYDLHVWVWRHNPSGTFAMWNPLAHCP
jgi:hypothetical protein